MKKLPILLAFVPFLILSGFASKRNATPGETKNPVVIHGQFLYDMTGFTMDYPCVPNAETVVYDQGQLHENFTMVLNENGSVHYTTHLNAMNCSGTGQSSGNHYNLPGSQSFNFNGNLDTGEMIVFYSRYSFRLISQGNAPNARVQMVIKHIYNRNGEEVSTEMTTETTCN